MSVEDMDFFKDANYKKLLQFEAKKITEPINQTPNMTNL